MSRLWRFAPHDRAVIGRIARELSCQPLLAQVLAARGLSSGSEARTYLSTKMTDLHAPELIPGIDEAAERIVSAIAAQRRITIYGDYDVDGVTATSILWHCLKLAGAKVDYYIPCRFEEGYGLNQEAIRQLHQEDPQRVLVTVDCGICSLAEAALARELGLELIITDHHTMADELPAAAVIVHPRRPGSIAPFQDLCGAGVAFKLAWAICQKLGDGAKASPRMREFLKSAVGLAAIGTVADMVPLVGENRILVKYGLETLLDKSMPGLAMLVKIAGLHENKRLTSEDIGFALAPRLNAAGRLGQARLAVELLTTDNRERAVQLAEYVDQLNKNRQTVERRIFKEAREQVEANGWENSAALVLADADWHAGVIGIVATRIAQHFERPAIMIALNPETRIGQGSGRTFANFDLHSALAACARHLEGFGGHKAAAGMRIQADRLDAFRAALSEYVSEHKTVAVGETEQFVDAEVCLADLTHRGVQELEMLGPFGAEHAKPTFVAGNVQLVDEPTTMGNGGRHLSMRIQQGGKVLRCVAFGRAEWAEELSKIDGKFAVCFTAGINRYKGYESVELQLLDWQLESQPAHASAN